MRAWAAVIAGIYAALFIAIAVLWNEIRDTRLSLQIEIAEMAESVSGIRDDLAEIKATVRLLPIIQKQIEACKCREL